MKRLVVFIGDKGGAGKSFACRAYVDVLRRRGVKPYLVDADGEVGHLLRYYGRRDSDGRLSREQGADGVRLFRLHADERDRVDLAEILDAGRDLIVLDLPAASVTLLRRVEEDYGFFRLAHEAGYAVTMVVVVTPEEASMASVRGAIELDPCADLVFARNLAFGDAQDFLVWDGSEREAVPPAKGKALLAQLIAEGRTLRDQLLEQRFPSRRRNRFALGTIPDEEIWRLAKREVSDEDQVGARIELDRTSHARHRRLLRRHHDHHRDCVPGRVCKAEKSVILLDPAQ